MDAINAWADANVYEAVLWLFIAIMAVVILVVHLIAHVDSRRPISRRERQHLRTVQSGKRAMASSTREHAQ